MGDPLPKWVIVAVGTMGLLFLIFAVRALQNPPESEIDGFARESQIKRLERRCNTGDQASCNELQQLQQK